MNGVSSSPHLWILHTPIMNIVNTSLIYLCNISPLLCTAPSCDITISSRRKIHGGQTYRSHVIVERDWFPQFDQRHVIVGPSHWRVIFRMYEDLVNWDNLLGSVRFTKIVFTCYTDKRVAC